MKFGLVHRVMTDALAVLGVLALVSSGELGRWVNGALLVGLVAALAVPATWQARAALRHLATAGPLVLLAVQIARMATGASVIALAIEFAAGLQLVRLATRRGAAHDQQVVLLALLHLIAGTVLGGGLGYGACFLGFLVVAPGALVLSHLRREVEGNYRQGARDRTGHPVDVPRILRSRRVVGRTFLAVTCLLSLPIFLFTAALFVLFPRVGLSLLMLNRSHSGRMVGFSDHVDLGAVGTLRSDPAIALRVTVPDAPDPPPPQLSMHLRGAAFDAYDGHAWTRSQTQKAPASRDAGVVWVRRAPDRKRDRVLHIDLEPIGTPVLFLPPGTVALQVQRRGDPAGRNRPAVYASPEGELRYDGGEDRGVQYDAFLGADDAAEATPLADRARYVQLPAALSARVIDLGRSLARGASGPLAAATAVEQHLRRSYAYDLSSPSGKAADPIDDFLFVSHRGHCEFYSTAMVLLLRASGIPARNVTGFVGGTYNRFGGYYAVRQGDAHSWVEVFSDARGWVTFDPTPPSDAVPKIASAGVWATMRDMVEALAQRWDRHVIGYDIRQQVYLFEQVSQAMAQRDARPALLRRSDLRGLAAIVLGLLVAGGSIAWMRRADDERADERGARPDPAARERRRATALYESLESVMSAQGIARGAATPPLRHAEELGRRGHPFAAEVLELTVAYLSTRFGGEPLDAHAEHAFAARVRALRSQRLRPPTPTST